MSIIMNTTINKEVFDKKELFVISALKHIGLKTIKKGLAGNVF